VFRILASEHDLAIRGFLSGGTVITLGDAATDANNDLVVYASGALLAENNAVISFGSNARILNHGSIVSANIGITSPARARSTTAAACTPSATGPSLPPATPRRAA
jgi:hypothetical protein